MKTSIHTVSLFEEFVNNFFESNKSKATATAINGHVTYSQPAGTFKYPVNLKVCLGKTNLYFQIGKGISPFTINIKKLSYCPDAKTKGQALYQMMEEIGRYQLDLIHDGVVFTFTPWSTPPTNPTAKSKTSASVAPVTKSVPLALKRPAAKKVS